jgi:hypothetical protein
MTLTAPRHRPAATTRRFGYVVAVLINAVLLYAANVWPGWEAVPFLTADTALVMGLVNASIIVSLAANAAYVITDPPWFKALGTVLPLPSDFLRQHGSGRCSRSTSPAARSTGLSSSGSCWAWRWSAARSGSSPASSPSRSARQPDPGEMPEQV